MRRFFVILTSMLLVTLIGCTKSGKTSSVQMSYDHSERFTEKELTDAAAIVKKSFENFEDCELQVLRYDEQLQTQFLEKERVHTSYADIAQENVLVLTSTFHTGKDVDAGFSKDTTYENWVWILEREDATSGWVVKDSGNL